eukprot:TRINITY_DN10615_c0_g1_i1.p1 TRINITY_DN10615_c0_g1~~TRINITY_DN10615_c0_g1_i1.p1  ORF type:complete len:301 (+),score=53.58 TRINITY_DN10615_c0_g1_i1:104-1006(+)
MDIAHRISEEILSEEEYPDLLDVCDEDEQFDEMTRVRQVSLATATSAETATPMQDARGDDLTTTTAPPSGPSFTGPPAEVPAFRSRAFALPPTSPIMFQPQIWPAQVSQVPVWPAQGIPIGQPKVRAATSSPLVAVQQYNPIPVVPVVAQSPYQARRATTLAPGGIEVLQHQVANNMVPVSYSPRVRQNSATSTCSASPPTSPKTPNSPSHKKKHHQQQSDVKNCTNAYSLFIAKELEHAEGTKARWPKAHTSQAKSRKGVLLNRLRVAADKWESLSDEQRQPFIDEANRNITAAAKETS